MSTDHGGPAFPFKQSHEQFQYAETVHAGATLRDYFAAKAMQGIYSDSKRPELSFAQCATTAYAMADAMLKERQS